MFQHRRAQCEITNYGEACVRQGMKPESGTASKSGNEKGSAEAKAE